MFLKWFSRIFHQKVFNKKIHQMVKNALHKLFWMIFMHKFNGTKKNGTIKKIECSRLEKGNVRLFHCPAAFRVLSTKWQASKISSLVGLRNVSIFFLPQIFFPFPKFVICWLHIGERKPFVSKQLFWWRSKNHDKTPPNSEKKKWFG